MFVLHLFQAPMISESCSWIVGRRKSALSIHKTKLRPCLIIACAVLLAVQQLSLTWYTGLSPQGHRTSAMGPHGHVLEAARFSLPSRKNRSCYVRYLRDTMPMQKRRQDTCLATPLLPSRLPQISSQAELWRQLQSLQMRNENHRLASTPMWTPIVPVERPRT